VSLGAASFVGSEGIAEAVEQADGAMYEDKARNRHARPASISTVTASSALP